MFKSVYHNDFKIGPLPGRGGGHGSKINLKIAADILDLKIKLSIKNCELLVYISD